ncbi:hypothetical protein U27_03807 [Candidatus Vecturithrix granuli]|uniref:DUF5320 domain-containing protein n=1 Tax=Vecturithrix granuli TaxID=1499967 RepID=A0A081BWY8_VECG1|nr:hypothetical protein U27_03807 [Candidatus Vecturithrix granuli]
MPGFDGTGPMGRGPRTGGGRGYCAPGAGQYAYGAPVVYGVGRGGIPWGGGRGFAHGSGRGRRVWRQWGAYPPPPEYYSAPIPTEDELAMLQDQAQWMEEQLTQINSRIEELKQK